MNEILTDSGIIIRVVKITPEIADKMLEDDKKAGGIHRKLKERKMLQYKHDLLAGKFVLGNSSILIGPKDTIEDGLHRLTALSRLGKEGHDDVVLESVVMYNYPMENRVHLDQGSNRTAADYLSFEGYPYATLLQGGVKRYASLSENHLGIFTNYRLSNKSNKVFSNSEVVELFHAHEDFFLNFASPLAREMKKVINLTAPSIFAIASVLIIDKNHSEEVVTEFFERLAGIKAARSDAEARTLASLRRVLDKQRDGKFTRTNVEIQYLVAVTWNCYIKGIEKDVECISRASMTKGVSLQ